MSTTQKLLSAAALLMLIGISSCNDDEGNGQMSKDEAKNRIAEFNSTATGDLQGLADADGVKAVQDFFDLVETDDPFGRLTTGKEKFREFFHSKGRAFRSIFVKDIANGRTQTGPFDFESHAGIYEWNPAAGEAGEFVKTGESDIIIILFPTTGSLTNNARLELSAYSEVEIYDEEFDEYHYEPAVLQASLHVNQTEVASIDLTISWDELGFPLMGDVTLEVAPYTASVSFDDTGIKTSSLSVSFLKNQEVLVATGVTVIYLDESKSEDALEKIHGYVQFRQLKVEGELNVEAANETEVDWNEIVHAALYHDGEKLGDIVFEMENDEPVPYLKYSDGSTEKLEDILKPVIDEIEELTEDLDNGE